MSENISSFEKKSSLVLEAKTFQDKGSRKEFLFCQSNGVFSQAFLKKISSKTTLFPKDRVKKNQKPIPHCSYPNAFSFL